MRILVAHFVSPARTGGMSRLIGTIHDRLAAAGHEISYLTTDDVPPAMRSRLGRLGFQFVVWRAAAAAARRGDPYDIINVHEPHGAVVATRRRGLGGAAVVAMTHGVERRGWEIALAPSAEPAGTQDAAASPADHAGAVVADAAPRRSRHLSQHRRPRVPDAGAGHSGVPHLARDAGRRPGLRCSGGTAQLRAAARRLLFAGTWLPRKGVQELAQAFTTLVDRGHDVHLDVLGAGVDPSVVAGAFGSAAAARVHLRTSRNDAEIAAAMRDADIFVLPSLFEGTPLTLIEAMWSGLPVVTTATAGMKDVVSRRAHRPAGAARRCRRARGRDRPADERCGPAPAGSAPKRTRWRSREYTWENAAATFASAYQAARADHG